MAGGLHVFIGLLLLPFIKIGVNGEDNLILPGRGYNISFPCDGDLVCSFIWQFSTRGKSDYIAVVSNGVHKTVKSKAGLKCTLQIEKLTSEDLGRYHCQQRRDVFSLLRISSSTPESNFMPAQTVSLHCILLTYEEHGQCFTQQREPVWLKWVDQADAEIQEDSLHQIRHQSRCNVTLIVTIQKDDNRKFRCQATVYGEVKTSVEFPVRIPARYGKGRGLVIESDPEPKDGNQKVPGVAVGVVGCVVVMAAALFAVHRRKTNSRLRDDSGYTTNADDDMIADDVTYADINLPTGFGGVRDRQSEPTEYASIRTAA